MASVFWNAHGILFIDYLEKGKTINSDYYMAILDRLRAEIEKNGLTCKRKKCCSTPKKISSEFRTNLNIRKSQHIRFAFFVQKVNFVWTLVCQNSKADISNSFQSHIKKTHHSVCEKRTGHVLSRYGQVGWYCVGLAMYCNTLPNQLGHTIQYIHSKASQTFRCPFCRMIRLCYQNRPQFWQSLLHTRSATSVSYEESNRFSDVLQYIAKPTWPYPE